MQWERALQKRAQRHLPKLALWWGWGRCAVGEGTAVGEVDLTA